MSTPPRDQLRDAIERSRSRPGSPLAKPEPGSTWELMADRRLEEIEEDLRAIRNRIDTLLWSIIGAVALSVITTIMRSL